MLVARLLVYANDKDGSTPFCIIVTSDRDFKDCHTEHLQKLAIYLKYILYVPPLNVIP